MGNGVVPEEGFIQDTLALINTAMQPTLRRMDDIVTEIQGLRSEVQQSHADVRKSLEAGVKDLRDELMAELAKKADKEDISTSRIERVSALVAKGEIEKVGPRSKTSKSSRAHSKSPWLLLLTGPQGIFIVALVFAVVVLLIAVAALSGRDANTLVPVPTENGDSHDTKGGSSCLFAPDRKRVCI